tara:strand:+ start:43352 stop:43504 length:153 start_codon:yes stop_codon:yes gene_type:complete
MHAGKAATTTTTITAAGGLSVQQTMSQASKGRTFTKAPPTAANTERAQAG